MAWAGGRPTDPYWQCSVTLRSGARCGKWSKKDPRTGKPCGFCTIHLKYKGPSYLGGSIGIGLNCMPRFYRNVLTKTLTQVVEDSLRATNAEQIALYEELALMRHAASTAVESYGKSIDLLHGAQASKDQALIETASQLVIDNANIMSARLREVRDMCAAIAQIEAKSGDKITIHTIHGVVRQMVRLMYDVLGDDNMAIAQEFEALVRDEVVLPAIEVTGTSLTPDRDVTLMDNSIPSAPG